MVGLHETRLSKKKKGRVPELDGSILRIFFDTTSILLKSCRSKMAGKDQGSDFN